MNWIDGVVAAILLGSAWVAYKKGFIVAFFRLVSLIVSLVLTYKLYPVVSRFLRQSTKIYESLRTAIGDALHLDQLIMDTTLQAQTEAINGLKIPEIFKNALIENNNPVVYNILDVSGLQDYVAGYIANICMNIIAMVVVLLIVTVGLQILISILDLIAKLPILNSANKLAGALLGFITGILRVWILFIVLAFFHANPLFTGLFEALQESAVALFLYEHNMLLKMVAQLFA